MIKTAKTVWEEYGLGIALAGCFLVSWLGQFLTREGGAWADDFWNATFENWQSEYLQLLSFVVFAKWWEYRGSPQSKDGDREMQRKLDEILQRVSEHRCPECGARTWTRPEASRHGG